ncbi:class I SAM-dependent methyltransferase [Streptomyces sp. NPDC056121]|uniref:class I SAM-dependent methyltransferase n=1 Tax=Streptomyces sp. NPDC056121 TaxID=3345718 RepID=UPI0035D6FAE0
MSRESVIQAYSQWTDVFVEEALIISRYVRNGARVLDLGCGSGRMAGPLLKRGCTYLGVDASDGMISAAQSLHPDLSFVTENIVDYTYGAGDYDAVLLMHNVIDSLYPYGRRRAFLASCYERLGDGILIFSSHLADTGPAYVAEDYHGATVHNFRAPHGWHITELEELGYQVLMSIQCERSNRYDWSYFVAQHRLSADVARQP